MAAGETLLKITDYPFAYSLVAILFSWLNADISNDKIVYFISIASALGTFLTITDPIGRVIKYRLKRELKKNKNEHQNLAHESTYAIQAIYTRSISLEVDRLVSLTYFAIILIVFNHLITYVESFDLNDQLIDKSGKSICDKNCVKNFGNVISFIALIIVIVVGVRNWMELKKHVLTAGTHQRGIGSEYVTQYTKDSMSKAIEQNDWPTADEWGKILENEIKIKKGKKDLLIQLVNMVFNPLYFENISIEATYEQSLKTGNFQAFPNGQWLKLKTDPLFLQIDDVSLLQEMESFYKLIDEYNSIQQLVIPIAQDIINKRTPTIYGSEVREIRYWVTSLTQGANAPSLPHLILTGTHPLKPYPSEANAKPFQVDIITNDGRMTAVKTQDVFDKFEILWKDMLEDVSENKTIQNMKKIFEEIHRKNMDLKKKYVEQIEKQWKV